MQSIVASKVNKVCAQRDAQNTFLHLVPGFTNYTENNCLYAIRQKSCIQTVNCYSVNLPYIGVVYWLKPRYHKELYR